MKRLVLPLSVLLALAIRAEAITDKAKEAAKQLDAAIAQEAKAAEGTDGDRQDRTNMRLMMLARIKTLLTNPEASENLSETLDQLSVYYTSEAVQKNLEILRQELIAERDARDKAALAQIRDILDRAGQTVREAKSPADLDGIVAELGKARQRTDRGRTSEDVRAAASQIEPTLQFAVQWQNYLSANSTGNIQAAQEALRSLSNSNQASLIPRSEILRRLAMPVTAKAASADPEIPSPSETVEAILAKTTSLDAIPQAIAALRKAQDGQSGYGRSDLANSVIQALSPIDKTYQDYKAGLATNLEISPNYGNSLQVGNDTVARLKAQLLLVLIPRYVGAPEATRAKPGEDVAGFLDRITQEARSRGDVPVAVRSREALRLLLRGNSFSSGDIAALSAFVSAQNQETAGQYALAVVSYQNALKGGSDTVPAKVIGERLASIKADHPKEFDEGMDLFLHPPVQSPNYPSGFPRNMRPAMQDPQAAQPQGAALLIPPVPVSSPSPEEKKIEKSSQ